VIVDHTQVAVANPTILDIDLHIIVSEWARIIFKWL
jgi:hypothetical protein